MLYSTFFLDDNTHLSVPIFTILEIVRPQKIHPILGASEVVRGLYNLRGKVITVLDANLSFEKDPVEDMEEARIYIIKTSNEIEKVVEPEKRIQTSPDNMGILVPRMDMVMDVQDDEVMPVPGNLPIPTSEM